MSIIRRLIALAALITCALPSAGAAQDDAPTFASRLNEMLAPISDVASSIVFYGVEITEGVTLPIVLVLLAGTAVFLTLYFKFINLRAFGVAFRTARGKYTDPDAPGQITHFQALSAALSATVGLGNIAGVAVAVGLGGPGATFWMILMGLCGMTTKFAECTLGVKYRRLLKDGTVEGGAMYYLRDGLREIGLGPIGAVLAVLFALFVIGGAFGAGNMFQSNQAFSQFSATFLGVESDVSRGSAKLIFGVVLAAMVGLVIIGGIVRIAHVTALLVPFMCAIYVATALVILLTNAGEVIPAFGTIITSAFSNEAISGGFIGVLIQGIRRAAFSNEAGLGSAPIAHSAVKTDKPASEGFVALLEPFVDTVIVCTMTSLVIVITGTWQVSGEVKTADAPVMAAPNSTEVLRELDKGQFIQARDETKDHWEVIGLVSDGDHSVEKIDGWISKDLVVDRKGIPVTSMAFGEKLAWFPKLLTIAVILFAFSTMISWSYYGQQGVMYLFNGLGDDKIKIPVMIYKIVFCLLVVVGASGSLTNVLGLSDAMVFAMVVPNLIGVYLLLPVVKREANSYLAHVRQVDGK